ncbi:MAG TPA: glycoside hydrolase [Verrucomicrobiae bacterium]|nr:glycoside hydrolase [Verrucomicrobiae bacterium]
MTNNLISPKFCILAMVVVTAVFEQPRALTAAEPDAGVRTITVDVNAVQGPLDTSFKECVGAGRANEGLRADWQDQLREARRECGFKYIRMHGLLTDDMGVYKEDAQGHPSYNWQYLDRLYDFLLSIDIKPFVELSFMPKDLASGSKTVFWWKGNVTPPKSYDKWADLIRHLVSHFQERYGHDEVKSWYFEVWNEPDLHDGFWTGTKEEYFKLYEVTAKAIKSVSPDYRVGGPATAMGQWDESFIEFCHSNHVPLDFVSSHSYGVKSGYLDETGQRGTVIDSDPDSVIGRMVGERKMIDHSLLPNLPLHFTEWSSAYTPTDFMHDTYQQAAFILSKVKGAYRSVDSMSYWVFTDIFEENGPRMTPFHGGFGLINYEDLKKPAFYAFKFLNELGPSELANADPASWVCKSPDHSVQALFWNYTPIVPPAGTNDQQFYKNEIPAKEIGRMELSIANLPAGSYSLKIYRTGYQINDVFTRYLEMGAPSQLTPTQAGILREQSNGDPESVETVQIETGKPFVRTFPMRQNDVYLVKLLPLGVK